MPPEASKAMPTEVGDYDILNMIAEGGMGTVYRARRRADGEIVAVKIIAPHAARNQVLLQRFKREFNTARQLEHPNIVRAIEFHETPPSPYLVMEYVEGESIGQKIEREGKISEADSIKIMYQVCKGLDKAHKQNLIHRDVKPDNILVTPDGIAKLTDMGLVKDTEGETDLTRTGRGLGTPHFMAPEQFRNAKNADVRCDVYSLGATLYMMVTGKMPFDGCGPLDAWMKKSSNEFPGPREIDPALSERMDWAIRRAMKANPELRPSSCREFIEDVTGQSTRAAPAEAGQAADLWYMVYRDDEGATHTVKGTTENIRKAYRDRLLGDAGNIRACRTKQGPFQPLSSHVEFRDLVIDISSQAMENTPLPSNGSERRPKTPTGRDSDAVEYDATVPHQSATKFPNSRTTRGKTKSSNRTMSVPMRDEASGNFGMIIWGVVIVAAVALGVASVLLLK